MNKKFAKINNGTVEYYQQPAWLLGNAYIHAIGEGYKEIEYRVGNGGIFEEGNKIIIETPKQALLQVVVKNPYLAGYSEQQIQNTNIDLLQGLHKVRRYSRGYLCEKQYLIDNEQNSLAVKRTYELVFENNILTGERSVITWYNDDDTVAFVKEDFVAYSAKDAASRLREIRQTRIDYLQYPEPQYMTPQVLDYIAQLFEHYKSVVTDYILSGSSALASAINAETNPLYLSILNATLPDGKTVKDSILYQIEGDY